MTDAIKVWQPGRNLYQYDWHTMTSDASFVSIINYFIHSDWMIDFFTMNNDLAVGIRDLRWGRWIYSQKKKATKTQNSWNIIVRALSLHLKLRNASKNFPPLAQICLRTRNWREEMHVARDTFFHLWTQWKHNMEGSWRGPLSWEWGCG